MNLKAIIFWSLSIFLVQNSSAQNTELLKKLYSNQNNQNKIETLLELCNGYTSYPGDSFIKYIDWGIKITQPNTKESLKFKYFKVYYLDDNSQFEASEKLIDSILKFCENNAGNEWVYCKILLEKGSSQFLNGDFNAALKTGYKGIKIAENTTDTSLIMDSYLSLGWLFMESNKYQDAIKWFEKGIALIQTEERQKKITNLYLNTASCYNNLGNEKRALQLVNKGLTNARNLDKWTATANGLMIRSDIYINLKKHELAKKDIEEALTFRARTNDTFYIASDMAQYSLFLASVNEPQKGIEMAQKGLKLIEKFRVVEKELYLYQALAKNYKVANQFKELSEVQEKIIELTDSVQKQIYLKNTADALANYGAEKQALTIYNQNLKLKVRQFYIYGFICFFIFLIPFVQYWFRKTRRKLKLKLVSDIEEERRRISNDLHDGVGAYASSIYTGIGNLENEIENNKVAPLKSTALELIEKLNQTVWVLDTESITVSDLFDKYKNWFLKIIPNYEGINYEFNDEISNNKLLKPQDSLDLLNMLQEITNNALKHSKCSKIICSIYANIKSFSIVFSDNGNGFDIENITKGNGLDNLKKRAQKLNGTLNINSTQTGTIITFSTSN